jgi:hypothetical protein
MRIRRNQKPRERAMTRYQVVEPIKCTAENGTAAWFVMDFIKREVIAGPFAKRKQARNWIVANPDAGLVRQEQYGAIREFQGWSAPGGEFRTNIRRAP